MNTPTTSGATSYTLTSTATSPKLIVKSTHTSIIIRALIVGIILAVANVLLHFITVNPAVFGGYTSIVYFIATELEQILPNWA
jgi:hypothetical protein